MYILSCTLLFKLKKKNLIPFYLYKNDRGDKIKFCLRKKSPTGYLSNVIYLHGFIAL